MPRVGRKKCAFLLDANPCEEIRNTRCIAGIYISGKPVDRAALRAALQKNF